MGQNAQPEYLYDVTVSDGKYRFLLHLRNTPGRLECLRHGEPWITNWEQGSKAIVSLLAEIEDLQKKTTLQDAVIAQMRREHSHHSRVNPCIGCALLSKLDAEGP